MYQDASPMKVVVQSSSLVFTLLSIVFNAPITKVKRKTPELGDKRESSMGTGEDSGFPNGAPARHSSNGS
jgi:hypothetical protein